MRGLTINDKEILQGYQLYHNFIREHQAIGKTPAEACGIKVEGKNKWKTIIQNASRNGELKYSVRLKWCKSTRFGYPFG